VTFAEKGIKMPENKILCRICGYIYDSEIEVAAFIETGDDWICPECGAGKHLFEPVE